jgi:hypothetical protein
MPGIGGSRGLNDSFPSLFLIVEPRKRLKASPPAASATASCRSTLRSWLVSIDDEILVFVATVEVASDAKDVFAALKLLTKSKAVKIEVTRYICFYSLLVTIEGATIMPTIPLVDRT